MKTGNNMIRIVITEDEKLFRKGMISLIHEFGGMEVAGEAADGRELLQLLQRLSPPPDLLLLDISMSGMDGMAVFPLVHQQYPSIKILVLSVHADDRHITTMIGHGANGYLLKNAEPEEMRNAILTIITHDYYFNDHTLRAMQRSMQQKRHKPTTETDGITAREKEILQLICREMTAPQIAQHLFISERTVEGHRNNLLLKTGAKNTAGLVLYAVRNGVVEMG